MPPFFLVHPPKTPTLGRPFRFALRLNFYTTVRMKQSRYKVEMRGVSSVVDVLALADVSRITMITPPNLGADFFPILFSRC